MESLHSGSRVTFIDTLFGGSIEVLRERPFHYLGGGLEEFLKK